MQLSTRHSCISIFWPHLSTQLQQLIRHVNGDVGADGGEDVPPKLLISIMWADGWALAVGGGSERR